MSAEADQIRLSECQLAVKQAEGHLSKAKSDVDSSKRILELLPAVQTTRERLQKLSQAAEKHEQQLRVQKQNLEIARAHLADCHDIIFQRLNRLPLLGDE